MSIKDEIDLKLFDLYRIYELYAWLKDDKKITILFENRMIIFYLFNNRKLVDEFSLSFNDKEDRLYRAISFDLIKHVFNNNKVYRFGNEMYYNYDLKPYLSVIVKDDILNEQIINNYDDKLEIDEKIKGKRSSKYTR